MAVNINLNGNLQFVETDTEKIKNEVIASVEKSTGIVLAEADPRRKFLESICYILGLIQKDQDTTGKMNLVYFSKADYLEHLAAFYEVERLPASAATAKIKVEISTPLNYAVTVPAGTRITAGDEVYFSIASPISLKAGETIAEGIAKCTILGIEGNGYVTGQLNKIVDNLPFVATITNTETTIGGADAETDDELRVRAPESLESLSVAGPDGAYSFWAKTASSAIIDVAVYSPTPGVVHLRPLLEGGEIPNEGLLTEVENVCNDHFRRPLTDKVEALAPEQVEYNIKGTYYISTNDSSNENVLKENIEQAIKDYVLWQKSKLGRDIDPNELVYFMRKAGAGRIEITEPVYTEIIADTSLTAATTHKGSATAQIAKEVDINMTYGGVAYD